MNPGFAIYLGMPAAAAAAAPPPAAKERVGNLTTRVSNRATEIVNPIVINKMKLLQGVHGTIHFSTYYN